MVQLPLLQADKILQENIDYEINYDLGTLQVINQAIINAGLPVQVQFENNATFGLQQRNFMGLRLGLSGITNILHLVATMVRLGERPFFTKQDYGEDPIRNTMYGVDFDYRNDIPRLIKWLINFLFILPKPCQPSLLMVKLHIKSGPCHTNW